MIQAGYGFSLRAESFHKIRRSEMARRQHLHRDHAVYLRLAGPVNNPHAPSGQFLDQFVMAKSTRQDGFRLLCLERGPERATIEHPGKQALRTKSPGGIRY